MLTERAPCPPEPPVDIEGIDPKAPIPWYGGKSRAASLVHKRLGNTYTYIEPFGGSLGVLLARPAMPRELVNDIDAYITNMWRSIAYNPTGWAKAAGWPTNHFDLIAARRELIDRRGELTLKVMRHRKYYNTELGGLWAWVVSNHIGRLNVLDPARNLDMSLPMTYEIKSGRGVQVQKQGIGSVKQPVTYPDVSGRGVQVQKGARGRKGGSIPGLDIMIPHTSFRDSGQGIQVQRKSFDEYAPCNGRLDTAAHLMQIAYALQRRLWRTYIYCKDWKDFVSPTLLGLTDARDTTTGILLDPPYSYANRNNRELYSYDGGEIASDVREWAIRQANKWQERIRIAFCSYDGDFDMPDGWWAESWGRSGPAGDRKDEIIWFSPHCLRDWNAAPEQGRML